jgi:hypothetical protein
VNGKMKILKQNLMDTLFKVWASYFGVSSLLFCIATGVIVWWISVSITEPIL